MSVGWAQAWWPHWARAAEPFLLVAREAGAVVGLAPLVRRRNGPLRVLGPVGVEPGDYWDVLAVPARRAAVAAAVADALRDEAGAWDAGILRCLPPESPVAAATAALPALVQPPIPAPAIELPGDFDAYLAGLSASHRQNLRRHLRRLDQGEVELIEVTDLEGLPEVVQRWQDFRRRQWEAAGRVIDPEHLSPRFAAFMLDCLRALVPRGNALVWEFRRADHVIGTYLNFVDEHAFHWYLGGFDPAVTRLGLGKIAIGHGIRTSIEAGRRRYDFGRGAEPYKYWYGAADRLLPARVVGSPSARGRLGLLGARAALRARRG
ncbi:MAG: GNAT family N-acetyltransferase [Solirubrobacteraceae bacterium]